MQIGMFKRNQIDVLKQVGAMELGFVGMNPIPICIVENSF